MAVRTHERLGRAPLRLIRTVPHYSGVRGILYLPDGSSVHTLEDKPISPGAYFLNPDNTGKHRNWVVETILGSRSVIGGRVNIEIHAGNFLRDSEGCILVGELTSSDGIVRSRDALRRMRAILDRDSVSGEDPRVWMLDIRGL